MDRRKSIKSIVLGTVAGGLALHGCKPETEDGVKEVAINADNNLFGRTPEEKELIEELKSERFLNPHEMETVAVLSNLILPANDKYGGATDAGVPDFIEFMSKDIPEIQIQLRGGLMWLDHDSNSRFQAEFKKLDEDQQKIILDEIAYPDADVPLTEQPLGIQFFSMVRNLTMTGYYTSKMGIADLGYKGNRPNVWDGVPDDVLKQHGVAYEPEWLAKCIDQDKRGIKAEWDENGNLLT